VIAPPSPAERLAARLLTGPLAFALAGAIDIVAIFALVLRRRLLRRYHGPGDGS
jgi:hypothetical protein